MGFYIKNIVGQDYLISFTKPEYWRNDVKCGKKEDATEYDTREDAEAVIKKLQKENIFNFMVKELRDE